MEKIPSIPNKNNDPENILRRLERLKSQFENEGQKEEAEMMRKAIKMFVGSKDREAGQTSRKDITDSNKELQNGNVSEISKAARRGSFVDEQGDVDVEGVEVAAEIESVKSFFKEVLDDSEEAARMVLQVTAGLPEDEREIVTARLLEMYKKMVDMNERLRDRKKNGKETKPEHISEVIKKIMPDEPVSDVNL